MKIIAAFLILCSAVHAQMVASLVVPSTATDTAARTGLWQDASTWADGTVPVNGEKVYIPPCCNVTNNGVTADVLWVHVAGTLTLCDHCDTQLNVHTLFVPMGGRFDDGHVGMPRTGKAVVEWLPGPFLPGDWTKLSRGVICHGEFTACGAEKTAWDIVDGDLAVGAVGCVLGTVPYGWKPGDTILIAGTDSSDAAKYQTEQRTITAVSGRTVSWSQPLVYKHFRWRSDLPFHCANLTRNVVFRSRDTSTVAARGHLMFMSPAVDLRYVEVKDCGRTDKSQPVTDPRNDVYGQFVPGSDANPRARYPIHWHRVGNLGPPASARGVVVNGSPGWGFVNHASNVQADDCICANYFGSGFTTEEGQERGSFRRCLASGGRGQGDTMSSTDSDHGDAATGNWGTDGSGFWLQGGLVEVSDCVSFDNSGRGFALFNSPLNTYPRYNGDPATADWIKFQIVADPSLLSAEYDVSQPVPSSAVLQRVFSRQTAYGNKIGLQSWTALFPDGLPAEIRGSITGFKTWGRGNMLHLEYTLQFNVSDPTVLGDSWLRGQYKPTTNAAKPILVSGKNVTISNYSIDGCFRRDGNNWPKPIPIGFVGPVANWPTISIDGVYPIINADTGEILR